MAETMKDAEFEAFLTQLRSETPDMGIIKSGMEKFGTSYFSDSQKEAFLNQIFPAPIKEGAKESEKLGFQNLNGIKTALKAMQELHGAGAVSKEAMSSFLTMTNPKNGRNVLTTIGLNTWAAEKKDKKLRNEGSKELVDFLEKQESVMVDIQETLGKIDPEVLAKAANTPDDSHGVDGAKIRRLTFMELASKSPLLMKDNYEKLASYHNEGKSALTIDTEKTALNIDSGEKLKVGGENTPPLNIEAKPKPPVENPEENTEEPKVATLDPGGSDLGRGRDHPKFGIVKEQDIIDYMFENWFLGGVNLILEGAYKLADRFIDAFTGGYEKAPKGAYAPNFSSNSVRGASAGGSGTPKSGSASSREGKPSAYSAQLQTFANICSAEYVYLMENFISNNPDKIAAITQGIKEHIGQKPNQWKPQYITKPDGKREMVFNPAEHVDLINMLNERYGKDKQGFTERLDVLMRNPEVIRETLSPRTIHLASHLATVEYAARHPDEELMGNDAAKNAIGKEAYKKMLEITAKAAEITNKTEQDYRRDHQISKGDKLTDKQKEEVSKASQEKLGEFLIQVSVRGSKLNQLLDDYHKESDTTQKAEIAQNLQDTLRGTKGTVDFRTAAREEIDGQRREDQINRELTGRRQDLEGRQAENKKRKVNLDKHKARINNQKPQVQQQRSTVLPTRRKGNSYL